MVVLNMSRIATNSRVTLGLVVSLAIPIAMACEEAPQLPETLANVSERFITRWVPPEPPKTLELVNDDERNAWNRLGQQVSGYLMWSSNRNGNHDLFLIDLTTGEERQLTSNPHVDFFARFSPDGQLISFLRSQRPWVSFRDELAWDLYVMNADGTDERQLVSGAYHPTWLPDGTGLLYVNDNRILRFDLASGRTITVYDGTQPPTNGLVYEPEQSHDGLIAVTLRGVPRETVGVLDLAKNQYIPVSSERACQITWVPGRQQLVWIDNGGHGGTHVATATFDQGNIQTDILIDLPGDYSHEYFPRVTSDGQWLVWGASAGGHEHDRADYEIFTWQIGTPVDTAMRLTFSSANDQWPDLWIHR